MDVFYASSPADINPFSLYIPSMQYMLGAGGKALSNSTKTTGISLTLRRLRTDRIGPLVKKKGTPAQARVLINERVYRIQPQLQYNRSRDPAISVGNLLRPSRGVLFGALSCGKNAGSSRLCRHDHMTRRRDNCCEFHNKIR